VSVKLSNANTIITPRPVGPGDVAIFPPVNTTKPAVPNGYETTPLVKVQAEPTPRKSS